MSVEKAVQYLRAAIAELEGAPQAAAPAPAPAPSAGASSYVMRFGTHKGKSLVQLYNLGELKYLGWVADKFGFDRETGQEDPKWAVQNARVRAEARSLLDNGVPGAAIPAPAPAPSYPAPVPTPGSDFEDDIPF